jgi:glycosyltransferase involved in cell wall biosynthesis
MPLAEERGGGEVSFRQLMEHGQRPGIEWKVVFLENGPLVDRIRQMGISTQWIDAGRLRQPHKVLSTIWRISRIIKAERLDVVLSWMAKPHLYGGPAAFLRRVPAIWFQHGLPSGGGIDRVATVLPARGILACSRTTAAAQQQMWPSRPVRVVYPGVELERFDAGKLGSMTSARRQLGLPEDVPIVGIVGRLQRWKGIHVLVEAMPAILKHRPRALCVIVGGVHKLEPDYPDFLHGRIAELNLKDNVRMVGLQSNVPLWMQAMDVVVHASEIEPFGLVVVEAMALQKPLVSVNRGGPTEVITDGVDGLLTPFGDVQALASAVLHLFENPAIAKSMGQAAGARARQFSVSAFVDSLIAAVRDLAAFPEQ